MLIVMKFGGTSVGSAERISQAARLAVDASHKGHQVVVVTSAMSRVTDSLVDAAQTASRGKWDPAVRQQLLTRHRDAAEALTTANAADRQQVLAQIDEQLDRFEKLCFGLSMVHELTPRLLDAISGTGELLAAPLVAAAIRAAGRPSSPVPATELIVTTEQFGAAEPVPDATEANTVRTLGPMLERGEIPVVTGFIGATVNGVMTANPGEVPNARSLVEISYSEASELAYYGAKVLHYKTIVPAFRKRIPVRILNSFNPMHAGTRVSVEGDTSTLGVKAVTSIRKVSLIAISGTGMQGIPGIVAKAFDVVAEQQANVLMISQASSENNICFVISSSDAPRVVRALKRALEVELLRGHIEEITDQPVAVVAAVGD